MRKMTLLLLLATLVVAGSIPASAHDHKPPRTKLRSGDALQQGKQSTYCWTSAGEEPGEYSTICADYRAAWPRPQGTEAGKNARIRIFKTTPPEDFDLHSWRKVDQYDFPVGDGRSVDYKIEPGMSNGNVVHDVFFRLPTRTGHFYLRMFGTWTDSEGSEQPQDSSWSYHLRLR